MNDKLIQAREVLPIVTPSITLKRIRLMTLPRKNHRFILIHHEDQPLVTSWTGLKLLTCTSISRIEVQEVLAAGRSRVSFYRRVTTVRKMMIRFHAPRSSSLMALWCRSQNVTRMLQIQEMNSLCTVIVLVDFQAKSPCNRINPDTERKAYRVVQRSNLKLMCLSRNRALNFHRWCARFHKDKISPKCLPRYFIHPRW